MQNSTGQTGNLQNIITDTLTQMANTSLQSFKPLMEGMINNLTSVNKSVKDINLGSISLPNIYKQTCDCCPPEDTCPPHCIASITRVAAPGERILVPFLIKNTCSQTKTFRVGVRELKDQDGNMAPLQPQLNKNSVTLDPGRSEKVSMLIDLEKFENGTNYTAEIVIREKDINQNICFTLTVNNNDNLVCAEPKNEQQYRLRWQSWKSHYYCEPATNQRLPTMKN